MTAVTTMAELLEGRGLSVEAVVALNACYPDEFNDGSKSADQLGGDGSRVHVKDLESFANDIRVECMRNDFSEAAWHAGWLTKAAWIFKEQS